MKEKTLSLVIVSAMVLLNLALISCAKAPLSKSEKDQQQDSVRDLANKTLSDLYTKNPAAKDAITAAAGYAVFSDFGFKVIFFRRSRRLWRGGEQRHQAGDLYENGRVPAWVGSGGRKVPGGVRV